MAKAKKTKKEKEVKIEEQSQPLGEIKLSQKKYDECEWCFQFDDDEAQVFAWTDDQFDKDEDPKIVFTITNLENSYISFSHGKTGKKFKIFAREMTNEGISLRDRQREAFKQLQNGSENKETEA